MGETLDINTINRAILPINSSHNGNFASPNIPYKDIIPPIKDEDYIKFSFEYSPLIYFSNRQDDENFSTSMLFAGFTQTDKEKNTQALKNSFFMFDLSYNNERSGYLFSKIYPSNFVTNPDEEYSIKGIFLLKKKYMNISPLLNMDLSLRFFNGRLGGVSEFASVNGSKYYTARINFQTREILLPQTNISFFEIWNPELEQLQNNQQQNTPPKPNSPSGGIVLPSGKIIPERVVVCNDDFNDSNDC